MSTQTPKAQVDGLRQLLASNAQYVIGIDEVGLGAWAGPLVVAGVVLKKGWGHPDIKDSKKFSGSKNKTAHEKRRDVLHKVIRPNEVWQNVVKVSSKQIDKDGVQEALQTALYKVARMCWAFYHDSIIVVDGNHALKMPNFLAFPKADDVVPAVGAASIVAKVARDSLMMSVDQAYPGYGFRRHVGYGTPEHKKALAELGPCPIHRRSYKPVQELIENGRNK